MSSLGLGRIGLAICARAGTANVLPALEHLALPIRPKLSAKPSARSTSEFLSASEILSARPLRYVAVLSLGHIFEEELLILIAMFLGRDASLGRIGLASCARAGMANVLPALEHLALPIRPKLSAKPSARSTSEFPSASEILSARPPRYVAVLSLGHIFEEELLILKPCFWAAMLVWDESA